MIMYFSEFTASIVRPQDKRFFFFLENDKHNIRTLTERCERKNVFEKRSAY